jgi:uncharacterized phage protein (TIGR02220 family)
MPVEGFFFLITRKVMASGKKNYFRHSNQARKDPKIMNLMIDHGKEAYFHFFCIIEMCAEQASDKFPDDNKFTFHRRTLCTEMMVSGSKLVHHLVAIQSATLLRYVLTENLVQLHVPNLAKYMGKYESKIDPNPPKERKENKIKEKKINNTKIETPVSPDALAVLELMNSILGTSFKASNSTMKFINARLNEKFVLNDFESVLRAKHGEWAENAEMRQYLRPQTLFGTKFEAYLIASRSKPKSRQEKLADFFASEGVQPTQI